MKKRPLGSSPIHVTSIGLGLAALGRPGYINLGHGEDLPKEATPEALEERAQELLDEAWEHGVRYFDAARSYGSAEQFLHRWLHARKIAPSEVSVGSKWGYVYTADWKIEAEAHEVKNHSLSQLRRQWPETQAKLGAYCKLYQIHSATLETGVLDDIHVLEELAQMREGGVTIGLSLSGPRQAEVLDYALDVAIDGIALFESVQATWNLLERSAEAMLETAHDAGMGVIVKEVLANGRLTSKNQSREFAAQRRLLEREAQRLETTMDALAIAAALAQPWADVVLSGAATQAQFRSNLQALKVNYDPQAHLALAELVEPGEVYWQTRSGLPWN